MRNEGRMEHPYYRGTGCGIIGSGATESAYRTVAQERMKLSGQRWSRKGSAHMLQLRVAYMNQQWQKIIHRAKTTKTKRCSEKRQCAQPSLTTCPLYFASYTFKT